MPSSTYRLQITPAFTLFDAAGIVPYLARLGVGWLYCSPLLQAERDSAHGYDVTDASRVDEQRGGAAGLDALASAAHAAGMGLVVDIVPNHLGVATPRANAWWWDVLKHGRASVYADHFDIDWAAGAGRLRIPVLGDGPDELSALRVEGAEAVDGAGAGTAEGAEGAELAYYDHRFPIAPGTSGGTPQEVHGRQHYELMSWRRADRELNYRRFFTVNTLAGVRVEDPRVFEDTHREIARWLREGLVDGLRVDHPDGLRDPAGYLRRLRELAGERPIWVEKILEGDERLPAWPVSGTTGYDALASFDRVFTDPEGEAPLAALAEELAGEPQDWAGLVRARKRAVGEGVLGSEIGRVARELAAEHPRGEADTAADAAGDAGATVRAAETAGAVEAALAELAAALPVYRTYLPDGAELLHAAAAAAREARPELGEAIARVLPELAEASVPAAARFQQTTGMIMAKGVEDNAFYRWSRLSSLTEVGGDPSEFAIAPERFHALQRARLRDAPASMTTLTTHDTKRSEDARARLAVLAEAPERWREFLSAVRGRVRLGEVEAEVEADVAATAGGEGTLESIVWQAIIAAWPAGQDRLQAYALKAAREGGVSTSWTDPDPAFEARLSALVAAAHDDSYVHTLVQEFVAEIAPAGRSNSLGLKLLQLLAPGTPDVYQGTERWDRSLVDPDNRRAVDFGGAEALLRRLDAGWLPPAEGPVGPVGPGGRGGPAGAAGPDEAERTGETGEDGAVKLLLVSRALRLRRDRPELFTGYEPIAASGPRAARLIGFDRGGALALATRLPHGLAAGGGWQDTTVDLGARELRDELNGCLHRGVTRVAELFARYPVALLAVVS